MSKMMIRYIVKPEAAAENEALVSKVFAELNRVQPEGIRYASFILQDGVSFAHVVSQDDDKPNPLMELAAFQEFVRGIGDRAVNPPEQITLREIGSYGFWDM
jgi:hypothetical protein